MRVQPYLYFDGRTEEALEFYKKVLNAEVLSLMRFKNAPPGACGATPPPPEKVMHSEFRVGDSVILASDGMCGNTTKFEGISLTLSVESEAEADRVFAALGDGGKVQMPLTKTFFSPRFGMVADRFGVSWMIIIPHQMSR